MTQPTATPSQMWVAGSRRLIDVLDPKPESVDPADIVHALSRIGRYNCHTPAGIYTVAEHSLLVASVLPEPLKVYGLLHDAAEAYIGDIHRPIKRILPEIVALEEAWLLVIWRRFKLKAPTQKQWNAVKAADEAVGEAECKLFCIPQAAGKRVRPADVTILSTPPHYIESKFNRALQQALGSAW